LNAALASDLLHAHSVLVRPIPSLEERGVVEDCLAVLMVSTKKYAGN
jgi:hypothetical protein